MAKHGGWPKSVLRGMRMLYRRYQTSARVKNHYWNLPEALFHKITSGRCHYCNAWPSKWAGHYKYNGVDRKNNKRGYEPSNVVGCCFKCNMTKGREISYQEMLYIGRGIKRFRERFRRSRRR